MLESALRKNKLLTSTGSDDLLPALTFLRERQPTPPKTNHQIHHKAHGDDNNFR